MPSTRTATIIRRVVTPLLVAGLAAVAADRGVAWARTPHRAVARALASTPTSVRPAVAAPARPERVALWGDSLAWESRDAFLAAFAGQTAVHAESRTLGGTAPCDWEQQMLEQAGRIDLAVLEFSGNSWTDCMRDPATGDFLRDDALLAKYEHDITTIARTLTAAGTDVLLIGAPRPGDDSGSSRSRIAVRQLYRVLATRLSGVTFADAGAAVLDRGRFTKTLPCLPFEDGSLGCHDGRIQVRNADALHLCPFAGPAVDPFVGRCPLYSSGAYRFGNAMHDAVVAQPRDTAAAA
jgi:hypothetical protein